MTDPITDPLPVIGGNIGTWGAVLNPLLQQIIDFLNSDIVGTPGAAGESAYQIALDAGFVGSQATWLASLKGAKGDPGATGAAGSGVNIHGLLANSGLLPATGNAGDAWLVGTTSASNLYVWDTLGSQWTNVGTIQGPQGSPGSTGGPGPAGNTVLTGTATPPSNSLGANGDSYYNTSTSMIYSPKAAGVWPAGVSLKGATGSAGAAGATGALFRISTGSAFSTPSGSTHMFTSPSAHDPATNGETVIDGDIWLQTA